MQVEGNNFIRSSIILVIAFVGLIYCRYRYHTDLLYRVNSEMSGYKAMPWEHVAEGVIHPPTPLCEMMKKYEIDAMIERTGVIQFCPIVSTCLIIGPYKVTNITKHCVRISSDMSISPTIVGFFGLQPMPMLPPKYFDLIHIYGLPSLSENAERLMQIMLEVDRIKTPRGNFSVGEHIHHLP